MKTDHLVGEEGVVGRVREGEIKVSGSRACRAEWREEGKVVAPRQAVVRRGEMGVERRSRWRCGANRGLET